MSYKPTYNTRRRCSQGVHSASFIFKDSTHTHTHTHTHTYNIRRSIKVPTLHQRFVFESYFLCAVCVCVCERERERERARERESERERERERERLVHLREGIPTDIQVFLKKTDLKVPGVSRLPFYFFLPTFAIHTHTHTHTLTHTHTHAYIHDYTCIGERKYSKIFFSH